MSRRREGVVVHIGNVAWISADKGGRRKPIGSEIAVTAYRTALGIGDLFSVFVSSVSPTGATLDLAVTAQIEALSDKMDCRIVPGVELTLTEGARPIATYIPDT
jgi:hypothetical protein